mgnify:CR=1 FL=1
MLGYPNRKFFDAVCDLKTLQENPEDMELLRKLQLSLRDNLIRIEIKKKERKQKYSGKFHHNNFVSYYTDESDDLGVLFFQKLQYQFRMIGDSIAFLYLDRFSIKHALYNTENQRPKSANTSLGDKEGAEKEVEFLLETLEAHIPAVLCDLTNSLRHGDVCLCTSNDPYLIEVKSSKTTSSRTKRQVRRLRKLNKFYAQDEANDFRGMPYVRRRTLKTKLIYYEDHINRLIFEARSAGFAYGSPEEGLSYLVLFDEEVSLMDVICQVGFQRPLIFFLNEDKAQNCWEPYYPYTLSIKRPEDVCDFIRGRFVICVILDLSYMVSLARSSGLFMDFEDTPDGYIARLVGDESEGQMHVSEMFFKRIGNEFLSPKSLVQEISQRFKNISGEDEGP